MFFKDIVGQDKLKKRILQAVNDNRLSHAWLFFGTEGTGSLPMALAFAGYILCTRRSGTDACGVCAGCSKTKKFIHPDLHFIYPVNKTREVDNDNITSDDFITSWRSFLSSNPYGRLTQWYDFINLENKQGNINTEESKRLSSKMSLKSFEAEYKVVIIWQPEKMNDQAANKLLKLLEEPPPMTIFIMVSENPEALLPTVRSRCIQVKIPRITDDDLLNSLIERHHIEKQNALEITKLAEGNYLRALEMLDSEEDHNFNFIKFRDLMRSCLKSNIPELIIHAEELSSLTRERQKSFLEYGLYTIRESMALHFENDELVHITRYEKEFTPKFAPFINGKNITGITGELTQAIRDIERNGNGKIIFLDMALKLAEMIER